MKLFGHQLLYFPEIDSTNREAWRMVQKGDLEEGTIVRAGFQSLGRGQGSTRWESEKGKNLCVSVVIKPVFLSPDKQFYLNKAIALSVREAVKGLLPDASVMIKWPNDVYIGNRKVAGILIENAIRGSRLEHSIAGIGININQRRFDPTLPNPVSIAQVAGRDQDIEKCLDHLCSSLDHWYGLLASADREGLNLAYLEALLGYGEKRTYLSRGHQFKARVAGISPHGKLILDMEGGRQLEFDMKEVSMLF
ncbi:MAG: biotin--[acetyl-CoA-carboxylase] ligase [Bacteroidales bacterium]